MGRARTPTRQAGRQVPKEPEFSLRVCTLSSGQKRTGRREEDAVRFSFWMDFSGWMMMVMAWRVAQMEYGSRLEAVVTV